jgi:tetraacyldisaccharide 4'-kinase
MSGLERHWYRLTPLHFLLFPLSLLFRLIVAIRYQLYRSRILRSQRLPVPVIMVGNITVGGTGKTPLTLALTQQLLKHGWHPIIVSRGHGGTAQQQAVTPSSTAAQVGDEPLLMARRNLCPVWVGQERVATAQAALKAYPQGDVLLCDDGLQHYRLRRDVEIAVQDGARGTGNGLMLPAGPLREPRARLKSVDAVVINGATAGVGEFSMQLSGSEFYNLRNPEKKRGASEFHLLRVHAVAGIGNPQRFFRHLTELGLAFVSHPFPDHHAYSAADLSFPDCDAILLTEKDAVKCGAFADEKFWVLRVEAQFDSALFDLILRKITSHGRQAA